MQKIAAFIISAVPNYKVDSSAIQCAQTCLNEEMKVDGWVSLILGNRECAVLKFHNAVFINEGYVLNDEKVLKMYGNGDETDSDSQCERFVEKGILDLEHGSRFEGYILKKDSKSIPFGLGKMYDDDGLLVYEGIMLNWKRFGYGVSYHNNGLVEYDGYWCDDKRCGSGKLYDRSGNLVKECEWWDGSESDIGEYIGDGSQPIHIGTKILKLEDKCVLKEWDVSWLMKLESIEIGDDSFEGVKILKIEGLNKLKSLRIGNNSFTEHRNDYGNDKTKSFHIVNCESLEWIKIGKFSFSDFAGEFELKNLNSLQSIQIGKITSDSFNFYYSSFAVRGEKSIVNSNE